MCPNVCIRHSSQSSPLKMEDTRCYTGKNNNQRQFQSRFKALLFTGPGMGPRRVRGADIVYD